MMAKSSVCFCLCKPFHARKFTLRTLPIVTLCKPYMANDGRVIAAKIIPAEVKQQCPLSRSISTTGRCDLKAKEIPSVPYYRTQSENKTETVLKEQAKMASGVVDSAFPVGALVPKTETGVLNFLQKYPEYNGRNVTIAILDSGVDPRAAGLKATVDGATKVIERFDCSGCGDTDVSKKVTAVDGIITGLSGRALKITSAMKALNINENEYHIGLKSLHDLYPSKIREKYAADMKLKKWDEPHKTATAEVARQLHAWEAQNTDSQNISLKEKLRKEDLENSLEFLNCFEKRFSDVKVTYDCILFPGEKCWYAVIDTTETGDLENALLIGEYSKTYEIKNVDDYLSVSINVHDEGNVLEIVGMCSSHGTHVASIASGNHSSRDLDGVAPNAKIVSLTIGDGRLGSMETGTSLVRAIIKIMELCNSGTKIDVINMSYGEHAHWSNSGRIGELMNEVVNKYGVVWVASAGNHGPALCTIGTPPDISQPSCVGVGAYVSPQMMEAEYALRERLPPNVYTWTSRDPCVDGGRGVTVCAPGAAITSVPEYTMTRAQLMNGTSMAAPHVAGAVALLISGLKERGIKYSPFSIKRALCNTATKLDYIDHFAQGSGLLNVEKAFEYLVQYANQQENLIRFSVKVGNQNAKGIHLRHGVLKKSSEYNVVIEPVFFNDKDTAPKDKINFNVRLNLVSSKPWVQCGAYLDLCYSARTIVVKVDPVGLPIGVHSASIQAYDTDCIEKGPLFEIPVTVIQPHVLDVDKSRTFSSNKSVEFKPNTIQRDFILVPNNATWAVLKMVSVDDKEDLIGKFFVHTMQILPMKYCKALETMKILAVNNENGTVLGFKCEQNNILELCIAKYWSNFGDTHLKYSLEFHGVSIIGTSSTNDVDETAPKIHLNEESDFIFQNKFNLNKKKHRTMNARIMHAASGIHKIDIVGLGCEEINPTATLNRATMVLRPSETKISPLSATRDVIPAGRQIYQNLLTYNLHLTKPQEVALHVPILYSLLYESEFESQLWMLFDSNKMMVASGDAYSNSTFVKIEKGDYVVRLQVRHEKKDILEKINEATCLVTFKLQNPLSMDIYDHFNQCIVASRKMPASVLNNCVPKCVFVAPITSEKLNKASIPSQCSWLNGTIIFTKDEVGRKCDVNAFQYMLVEGPPVKKNNGNNKNNNLSKYDEYKELLRDSMCSMIPKLDKENAEEVYKEVVAANPKHLPAHLAFIQNIESSDSKAQFPFSFSKLITDEKADNTKLATTLNKIIELANLVINEADAAALLAYYGLKNDSRADASKIKTNMDKQKNSLLEALVKKGIATCKLKLLENGKDKEISTAAGQLDEIDAIYTEIGKFIDTTDAKVIYFSLWHAHAHSHYGRMTKYLLKIHDEKLNRDALEELILVVGSKKWEHIQNTVKKMVVTANPMGYRPF